MVQIIVKMCCFFKFLSSGLAKNGLHSIIELEGVKLIPAESRSWNLRACVVKRHKKSIKKILCIYS